MKDFQTAPESETAPAFRTAPELPERPVPIIIVGAGGIVGDAHLPAYRKAGFQVLAIVNRTREKAERLAEAYQIPHVFTSVKDAVELARKTAPDAVYDLALMPAQYLDVLAALPEGAAVLIQKPLGDDLEHARRIVDCCRKRRLKAAVNFQLRYAPFVMAARQLIRSGSIGEIVDMEVRLTTHTPWEIFPHVARHPRLEILYHSIHYIDLVRSFLGEPRRVVAGTFGHPAKSFASTRSTILMDYGKMLRAVIHTNHDHDLGPRHQESFIKWEGTKGAVKAGMGLLLNYPEGVPDTFEYAVRDAAGHAAWKPAQLEGSWFPDAFVGTMADLMRYAEGSAKELPTSVEDVIHTMEIVEKAYESN